MIATTFCCAIMPAVSGESLVFSLSFEATRGVMLVTGGSVDCVPPCFLLFVRGLWRLILRCDECQNMSWGVTWSLAKTTLWNSEVREALEDRMSA